ncbi:uncharacterized protein LOC143300041 [Babylonia areolata]|uniref:uncharacterized protein LOC143300041 n=1 Tax=Babylonia areolata TaxID=304850 RepID=UPI003FD31F1E
MPRKADASDEKGRGSCCTLEAVKHFLQSGTIPKGYTKNDKRALRRRAKSFVLTSSGELYFTGGRSRHNKGLTESETVGAENPEDEPDHTQVLRKVVFSEEEQQEIINKAHVGEDGSHHGMEKTTEYVSNQYYWMGIISGVRNTIHNCLVCSSRIKNPGRSLALFPPGYESATTSQTSHIAAANSSASKSSEIPRIQEELPDANGLTADDIDVNEGEDGLSELSITDPYASKQEVETGPTDVFSVTKEVCSHFWQKVEIQIFGPFQARKKLVYVVVALDSYSQFPEAVTMEVLSSATLTNFFLNLFCRYGSMEKLLLLQNQVTRNKDLYINLQDVQQAGVSPLLLFPHVNPLDDRWNHVEKSLIRFISLYPDFWFHCLEAFMVPLRIALPPEAVYSPYYLVHGREAPVPDKLSQLYSVTSSGHTEVQLTEDQEKQTVEMVTAAYGIYSDNPSIPLTLPEPSNVESTQTSRVEESLETDTDGTRVEKPRQQEKQKHPRVHGGLKRSSTLKRRCGRSRQREKEKEILEEKEEASNRVQMKSEVTEIPDDAGMDADDDSDRDATYEPEVKSSVSKSPTTQPIRSSSRQRKATYKAQASEIFTKKFTSPLSKCTSSVSSKGKVQSSSKKKTQDSSPEQSLVSSKDKRQLKNHEASSESSAEVGHDTGKSLLPKKKRGRPRKDVSSDDVEMSDITKIKFGSKKQRAGLHSSIIKNMKQLSLDTLYFIIKQCLERDVFPPGISSSTTQSVRGLCNMFFLKDGKLYSSAGKSAGRCIITGETARVSLLRKAHARGEVHHGRISVLKYLNDLNVFWNGMSLDLDAFIHSCPECILHNPLGRLPEVHIPSKSITTAEGREEEEPHISEDEEEESSYEDLIQYLTDGTFPPTTTSQQQQQIQHRSQSFTIIKGSLYYQTQRMTDPRQVLFSESLKQSAIEEAHIENGQHLSQQDTQARLRQKYFWSGMTFDVLTHVLGCCMKESLCTAPVLHRNPVIQERVDKIRSYYSEGIPKLDTSAIRASEISETATASSVDTDVTRAVEKIVEDVGQSLSGSVDHKAAENSEGNAAKQSPFGNIRSRKDAHKCQHCGKFVSGNVAYRIHLYKHTGVKPFTCSTCGKSFTTSKSLQVHTRKHTGVKPYLCNQCGREFFRGTSFKYHLKTHTRAQVTPLPCDQCDREFLTKNRLVRHKQYKHPAEPKVYMCGHCGRIFRHARSLKTHEQSHFMKYRCQVCKKEFNRADQLESHTKAGHADPPKAKMVVGAQGQKSTPPLHSAPPPPQRPQEPALQQQQQQVLPHILYANPQTQVVQTIRLNTGNISEIQWTEEGQQVGTRAIIITTERPSSHFTIEGAVMEQVASQITAVSEQGAAGGGGILTISNHPPPPPVDLHHNHHLTLSEHAGGTAIQISEGPAPAGAHLPLEGHQVLSVSEGQQDAKANLDTSYHTHTPTFCQPTHMPTFSQPTHTTAVSTASIPHILTQVQLPALSSSSSTSSQNIQNPVPSTAVVGATAHLPSLHSLQPAEMVLQQEAVPVQYEVECLPDPGQADLSAVHLLAQASMADQGVTLRQAQDF